MGCAALVMLMTPALPQTKPAAHIDVLEVVSSGFSGPGEPVKRGKIRQRFSRTPAMTAQVGTSFGMTVRPVGQPDGAEVTLALGLEGAAADRQGCQDRQVRARGFRRGSGQDRQRRRRRASNSAAEEQLVKGNWRVEVWNGRRRLAVRRFAIR